ncbi:MAG: PEGA domain-containing protein [Candidatus Andersenbacteria bacterium]|nr:PEGA domain-containing protein [Candidatus Andersenbacteria bacterium]
MQKSYRQLLLFAATIVFLALAPLVVFYAMGYRLADDAGESSIGVLLVETVPRRARISVNGRAVGTSPQSIANLPPGEVTVVVEKEGYKSWQKKVAINATEVTELRGIRLFPDTLQSRTLLQSVELYSLSPNRQLLAAYSLGAVHIIDEDGSPLIQPVLLPHRPQPRELLWSPDSHSLLIIDSDEVRLLNTSLPTQLRVITELFRARDIVWDPRIPGRLLAVSPAGHLIAYQSTTNSAAPLAENVSTFATSSRHIFAVQTNQQHLTVINVQGQPIRTLTLPKKIKQLKVTPGGQAAVWYEDGSLAIIGEAGQLIPVAPAARSAGFSPDGQLLYVQTDDTSLHIFNISDERLRHIPLQQLYMVVRFSRPVRDPQWFAGGQHIMYQVEDEIIITEIDTRDHPVSYTADSTNLGSSRPSVGRDGDYLFYLKNYAGSSALVATALTV